MVTFGNHGNNHIVPTWLGLEPVGDSGGIGDSNSHHSIAHSGDDRKLKLDAWHFQQMADLFGRLKSTQALRWLGKLPASASSSFRTQATYRAFDGSDQCSD